MVNFIDLLKKHGISVNELPSEAQDSIKEYESIKKSKLNTIQKDGVFTPKAQAKLDRLNKYICNDILEIVAERKEAADAEAERKRKEEEEAAAAEAERKRKEEEEAAAAEAERKRQEEEAATAAEAERKRQEEEAAAAEAKRKKEGKVFGGLFGL